MIIDVVVDMVVVEVKTGVDIDLDEHVGTAVKVEAMRRFRLGCMWRYKGRHK